MKAAATKREIGALLKQGASLHQAGRHAEALQFYDAALKAEPRNGDALHLKGIILHVQGHHAESLALIDRAAKVLPKFADIHNSRGNSLVALERPKEALFAYMRAIKLKPADPDYWLNAGLTLHRLKRFEEATALFRKMTIVCPDSAKGHYNLGVCLTESLATTLGDERRSAILMEAAAELERALTMDPNNADTFFALANLTFARGDHAAAVAWMRRTLELRPDRSDAWANLGGYFEAQDKMEDAIDAFDHALTLKPNYVVAIVNRGLSQLALGQFEHGWDGYAQRFDHPDTGFVRRPWPWPQWQGEPLNGKRILLWSDQGIGDEVLCSSMMPDVASRGATCTLECSPRLVPLYMRSFPDTEIVSKDPATYETLLQRQFDYQCSVIDVGRFTRRSFGAFPNRVGQLVSDPARAATLRRDYQDRFGRGRKLVGISWRSMHARLADEKSLPLDEFAPLLSCANGAFLSLQYGDYSREIEEMKRRHGIELHQDPAIDAMKDLDSLAAQISALDLVVTISNSTAHLAAALGVPTFMYIPHGKRRLWYWLREGAHSNWYRSVHIFRGGVDGFLTAARLALSQA